MTSSEYRDGFHAGYRAARKAAATIVAAELAHVAEVVAPRVDGLVSRREIEAEMTESLLWRVQSAGTAADSLAEMGVKLADCLAR